MPKKKIRVRAHKRRIGRKRVKVRGHQREGIPLKDISHYEFGSIAWQDAMRNNIREKMKIGEDLSDAEKNFAIVQHRHNVRRRSMNLGSKPVFKPKSRKEIKETIRSLKLKGADKDPIFKEAIFTLEYPQVAAKELEIATDEQRERRILEDKAIKERPKPFIFPESKIDNALFELKEERKRREIYRQSSINSAKSRIRNAQENPEEFLDPERVKRVIKKAREVIKKYKEK